MNQIKSLKTKNGGFIGGWYAEEEPPAPPPEPPKLEIEIDGKKETLTAEDVLNLKKQQASATQKSQKAAAVLKACERYGVEPDMFLSNAEASIAIVHKLMEEGNLDEQGNLIAKALPPSEPPPRDPFGDPPARPVGEEQTLKVVEKALSNLGLDKLAERLDTFENTTSRLVRLRLEDKILAEHKGLSEEDLPEVFALARNDRSKTTREHAAAVEKKKLTKTEELEKAFAKKYGIDVDEFNRNKLLESEPDGGAAALFKGKKISFKGGDGAVTPKAAMREFWRRTKQIGG
jgi:hypothetical protein